MESILTKNQKRTKTKVFGWDGQEYRITVTLRFDDGCGNGHNSFNATANIQCKSKNGRWCDDSFGCLHDEIAEHFPEYKHLLKWHLCSTDGPMHYIANTTYHASDKDCWGFRKGEACQWTDQIYFGEHPIPYTGPKRLNNFIRSVGTSGEVWEKMETLEIPHPKKEFSPKVTLEAMGECRWHECPFDSQAEAEQFIRAMAKGNARIETTATAWSEGKEPDLEAARRCAIWPEATLEQLQDKEQLLARLPALLAEFRKDMEALYFTW